MKKEQGRVPLVTIKMSIDDDFARPLGKPQNGMYGFRI
ncbi:hypothetical protein SAMN05192539_10505 [Paraburkholderia diazotrophica]|uniref:Uncharacterized protein n=1 Tax=Paraburkholderia diazotrophica TaxID=667676 RepID=A0A1H7EJZ0_9BURK|nr:hypothetical protein SAMN05192539_10505 [Paraburkholderia diazotrophica]